MLHIDKLLGPLAPNRQAARTAADPKHVVVCGAFTEQGKSVCNHLIADGGFVVYGLVDKAHRAIAFGKSTHDTTLGAMILSDLELSQMQVKVIPDVKDDVGFREVLKGKDAVFYHVDCLSPTSQAQSYLRLMAISRQSRNSIRQVQTSTELSPRRSCIPKR